MPYFEKRYHTPGTAPGTLTETPAHAQIKIKLTDYTDTEYIEKELVTAIECQGYLEKNTVTWIHIQGHPTNETLENLGELFQLHPLALEDVNNVGQRPKMDIYDNQLLIIMSLPVREDVKVSFEQISIFIGPQYVISFHNGESDPFNLIRKRLRNHTGKIRGRGSDYLVYTLLDTVIDQGFPVLEAYGEQIESIEDQLLEHPGKDTLRNLHDLKRELLLMRRMLWPQREVLNILMRDEATLIRPDTLPYLRDCYDHVIQIMELLEVYREMTSSMLDVYLSSISNRLNDVMRTLTIIATIFIPLTFLVGVYGMNFGNNTKSPWAMPELNWYYSYPILWIIMILVSLGMIVFFKRRGWF